MDLLFARRNQYEKWLVRRWKIGKNVPSSVWRAIYPHVRAFELVGKPFEVWINGNRKSAAEIDKELRRIVLRYPDLPSTHPETLPKAVIVRETNTSQMDVVGIQLPFQAFSAHIHSHLRMTGYTPRVAHAVSESDEQRFEILGSMLGAGHTAGDSPQLVNNHSTHQMPTSTIPRLFTSTFHQNVMFSVSNDFAGLSARAPERILRFLQQQTSEALFEILRSASHYFTAQAIILNLFRLSIEIGDSMTVGVLLGASLLRIGVNQIVCQHSNMRYTAIERAAQLGHRDVVKVLLKHKADVNLSFSRSENKGALNQFAHRLLARFKRKAADTYYSAREMRMDWELFGTLAETDRQIHTNVVKWLASYDSQGHLLRILRSQQAHKHGQEWCRDDIFRAFYRNEDNQAMSDLIETMIEVGADLNEGIDTICGEDSNPWRYRLIDAVARRGDLILMQRLLDADTLLSIDTLSCAIGSGNEDLVRLLISHGADTNGNYWSYISPLAAAVRLQRKSMVDLVRDRMTKKDLSISQVFKSTWRVAVEVGSMEWIQRLLTICADVDPRDLGYALSVTIANGMRATAFELIDAGADTNYNPSPDSPKFDTPLMSALKQQDSVLVEALLETGAGMYEWDDARDLLDRAALWGDLNIVSHLLSVLARACRVPRDRGTALNTAIQRRDRQLINLIMNANVEIDGQQYEHSSALTAAVHTGDTEIVRYILERGADPHDSGALLKALDQSSDILELLLKEHAKRYPKGRLGWGTRALKTAIDTDNLHLFERLLTAGVDPLASGRSGPDLSYEDDSVTPFGYAISRGESGGLPFVANLMQINGRVACTPETIVIAGFTGLEDNCSHVKSYVARDSSITAMLAAIGAKCRSMVDLMLRYGAEVNFPASHGIRRTPLQRATEVGSMELVRLLIDKGADVNGAPAKRGGATALQLAAITGHISIARLLLEKGARIDLSPPPFGLSALENAAFHGRLDMVAVILHAGATIYNPNLASGRQQLGIAIALAEERGYYYIVGMLKQCMESGNIAVSESDTPGPDVLELFDYDKYASEAGD